MEQVTIVGMGALGILYGNALAKCLGREKVTFLAEGERLERMLEYMQTDEYLLQYAREKLGYVFPGDIKFYDEGS